jgi:uncharacterized protein with LGFP repeats
MFGPHRLVGAEADISFPSTIGSAQSLLSSANSVTGYGDAIEVFGTVRGRIGYDVNHWLYYVTGSVAWTYDAFAGAPANLGAPNERTTWAVIGLCGARYLHTRRTRHELLSK